MGFGKEKIFLQSKNPILKPRAECSLSQPRFMRAGEGSAPLVFRVSQQGKIQMASPRQKCLRKADS
jgi:hypothetical protein